MEEDKKVVRKLEALKIVIPVYYGYDDENKVLIDEDSIREEFEAKLAKILETADEMRLAGVAD